MHGDQNSWASFGIFLIKSEIRYYDTEFNYHTMVYTLHIYYLLNLASEDSVFTWGGWGECLSTHKTPGSDWEGQKLQLFFFYLCTPIKTIEILHMMTFMRYLFDTDYTDFKYQKKVFFF